ncbi:hypothetical protein [Parashewanella tropica]|uniref:hypothetical protein n=1 Tax=Parashewanella tropica TaxID=2547970 RepID=UPI001059D20D|nr:hypothetical protein [Parashewanella tropica]
MKTKALLIIAFISPIFSSQAATLLTHNGDSNFNQIHSGKEFCQIEMKQNKLVKACMPLFNFDKNVKLAAHVEGREDGVKVPPNSSYGFYDSTPKDSMVITVTNLQSQKIIYSDVSKHMQGLKCNGNYCVPWK